MNDDELRDRLRRIDPVPGEVPMEPPTTASSRARLERIMSIDTEQHGSGAPEVPARPGRTRWLAAGAAAAAVAIVAAVAVAVAGDDGDTDVAGSPLELSLGAGDSLSSCLAVDAEILADMPVAFAGTATSVEDRVVTLDVDRWYTDGDADSVQLHAEGGQAALIAGFDLEVGDQYLISAADGSVSFCGFSGPADPNLIALFDEAFAR